MERIDAVAARIAAGQHSLVTLLQLRDAGMTREQLRARLDRGQWSKVDRSVVRVNGALVTWRSRVMAAVLGSGPKAVASHRTAAVLWGLEGFWEPDPEVTIPRGQHHRRRPGIVMHQSTDLDRTTPTVIDGIPVTLVARTLLDLGAVVTPKKVHIAVDHARRAKLTNWNVLLNTLMLHARRGRDGVGALRSILDEHFGEVTAAESGFERLVYIAMCEWGLPPPVLQHEVMVAGRRRRLDLAYPDRLIGIELDGTVHLRKETWQADHVRQNALINAGWTILRYTWVDYREHQGRMFTEIKLALKRSAA